MRKIINYLVRVMITFLLISCEEKEEEPTDQPRSQHKYDPKKLELKYY
jgi:hypothetical protein